MDTPLTHTLVDDPSLWHLSLLVNDDSLDVLCRRRVGEVEYVAASIAFDRGASSRASALEEAVYANPMLLGRFAKVDVVFNGGFSLCLQPDTPLDAIDTLFPPDEACVDFVAPIDSRNNLVFRVDRTTANFVQRTFEGVRPTHSLAVLGRYFAHRSRIGNSSKMFLDIGPKSMNVLIFNQLGLAMASSFKCADINDAAYYALASANIAGLDFTNDEIRIAGNAERRAELMPILRRFARQVVPAIVPTGALNGDSSMASSPYPLIILPLCE